MALDIDLVRAQGQVIRESGLDRFQVGQMALIID